MDPVDDRPLQKQGVNKPSRFRNRKFLFWTAQLMGWGAYGVITSVSMSVYLPSSGDANLTLLTKTIHDIIGFGLSFVLHRLFKWLWTKSWSFWFLTIMAVISAAIFAALWQFLYQFTDGFVLSQLMGPDSSAYSGTPAVSFFIFLGWSAIYLGTKYARDLKEQKERTLIANALTHEAKLQMLRYQLNPHFLFNSLNSIHALIRKSPDRAELMVEELSDFLRFLLNKNEDTEISVKDEIEIIRSYLAIEKIRFEDKLEVDFKIDPAAEDFRLPALLIHPLVENAIKHGLKTSRKPLRIRLSAVVSEGSLRIEVSNSGGWTRSNQNSDLDSESPGLGLRNVRQRLEQVYPQRHRFDTFEKGGWVHATIEIQSDHKA